METNLTEEQIKISINDEQEVRLENLLKKMDEIISILEENTEPLNKKDEILK